MCPEPFIHSTHSFTAERMIDAVNLPNLRLTIDPSITKRDIKGRILVYLQVGPMSGYQIHRKLGNKILKGKNIFVNNNDQTGIKIAIQNLYPHLHSLCDRGLIEEVTPSNDPKHGNIPYKLTDKGWAAAITNGLLDLGTYLRNDEYARDAQPFFMLLLIHLFTSETLRNAYTSRELTDHLLRYLKDCLTQTQEIVDRWSRNGRLNLDPGTVKLVKTVINAKILARAHSLVSFLMDEILYLDQQPNSTAEGSNDDMSISKRLIEILSPDFQFIKTAENMLVSFEKGFRLLAGEDYSIDRSDT